MKLCATVLSVTVYLFGPWLVLVIQEFTSTLVIFTWTWLLVLDCKEKLRTSVAQAKTDNAARDVKRDRDGRTEARHQGMGNFDTIKHCIKGATLYPGMYLMRTVLVYAEVQNGNYIQNHTMYIGCRYPCYIICFLETLYQLVRVSLHGIW